MYINICICTQKPSVHVQGFISYVNVDKTDKSVILTTFYLKQDSYLAMQKKYIKRTKSK